MLKDLGLPQPAGLFVISPWADLTQTPRDPIEFEGRR